MTRSEFTRLVGLLITRINNDKVLPIIDYTMRSQSEQKRLYDLGRSKCDGYKIFSRHQAGLAVDFYFVMNSKIDFGYETQEAKDYAKAYHDYWVELGGKPMIDWDLPHYEG